MNIVVFGASGGTGQQIVLQALALGHHVTAVVRRPERFKLRYDRLRVVAGDALHPGSFAEAMAGQDIVISALGVTGFRKSLRPMTFHIDTARNIVAEMQRHGVGRFIGITSVGVVRDPRLPSGIAPSCIRCSATSTRIWPTWKRGSKPPTSTGPSPDRGGSWTGI